MPEGSSYRVHLERGRQGSVPASTAPPARQTCCEVCSTLSLRRVVYPPQIFLNRCVHRSRQCALLKIGTEPGMFGIFPVLPPNVFPQRTNLLEIRIVHQQRLV